MPQNNKVDKPRGNGYYLHNPNYTPPSSGSSGSSGTSNQTGATSGSSSSAVNRTVTVSSVTEETTEVAAVESVVQAQARESFTLGDWILRTQLLSAAQRSVGNALYASVDDATLLGGVYSGVSAASIEQFSDEGNAGQIWAALSGSSSQAFRSVRSGQALAEAASVSGSALNIGV